VEKGEKKGGCQVVLNGEFCNLYFPSIIIITVQPFVGPWQLFQFFNPRTP
jgi:hypothetical protein